MNIIAVIKIAVTALLANKARAALTTLGIIIGISAVIAMLALGQGAQASILDQVEGLGSNTINILPVANFSGPQSQNDIRAFLNNKLDWQIVRLLESPVKFKEVVAVSPEISAGYEVVYRSRKATFSVYGVKDTYQEVRGLEIAEGRFITSADDLRHGKVAVLGSAVVDRLFGENESIGKSIRIDNGSYRVIGIAEEQGNNSFDERVYIPGSTASSILVGDKNYSQISLKVSDPDIVDAVAVKVEDELLDYYRVSNIEDANFTVVTSQDILSLTQTVTGIFTTLLAGIAGISLLVGGIGIMNIMLVSVTERTKEIGLRKAVGARKSDVLAQFLVEAVLLTLVGGIIGILLGVGLANVVGRLGSIPVLISPEIILLATSVSVVIGVVFGFYPAYNAAKLNPIDALRYE